MPAGVIEFALSTSVPSPLLNFPSAVPEFDIIDPDATAPQRKEVKDTLVDALKDTVSRLDIVELDKQLATCAPRAGLSILAAHGLRGELTASGTGLR